MMPNVIAIVDDPRTRGQLEAFVKELEIPDLHFGFFNTGYEFEQKYLNAKKADRVHPLGQLPGLEKFEFEQLEQTLSYRLAENMAFPAGPIQIKINSRTRKIEHIDPSFDSHVDVLGFFQEDVKKKSDFIGSTVLAPFQANWEKFQSLLALGRAQAILPLRIADRAEIAWCKLTGVNSGNGIWTIDLNDVTDSYRAKISAEVQRRKTHTLETDELNLFSKIDLILLKSDCVSGKVPAWVEQILRQLKDKGYVPHGNTLRVVVLKYEDDGVNALDIIHPLIDDLIFLPLDRLIFLQKLEIILTLPGKAKPSFLFTQDVHDGIEVSKLTKMERISDLGLSIRNPVRLVPGLLAHFYLNLYGENKTLGLWGKVVSCDRHPERKQEFLITFSFVALGKEEAQVIKRHISKGGRYTPFVVSERAAFAYNPDDLALTEKDKKIRNIAILDLEQDVADLIESALKKDIDQVQFIKSSGVASFFQNHVSAGKMALTGPVLLTSHADLVGAPQLSLHFRASNWEILSSLPLPTHEERYFGQPSVDVLKKGKGWIAPFQAMPGNDSLLKEMVNLALSGRVSSHILNLSTSSGESRIAKLTISPTSDPQQLKAEISIPRSDDLSMPQVDSGLSNLELIVVDQTLIPGGDIDAFVKTTQTMLAKSGVPSLFERVKFLITVDEGVKIDPRKYHHRDVIGVLHRPIEPRPLAFLVANALQSPFSIYRLENVNFHTSLTNIHVAKDVSLDKLAEYGAAIRLSRPIAPGTMLFLRGGLFENAPNQCLAARFYHCEPHPTERGMFLCALTYFGISDAFMKYARKWFRDTYAQSKAENS